MTNLRKNRWSTLIALFVASFLATLPALFSIPADGQAGTAVVRPSPPYWEVLAKANITAGGKQIPASGTLKFQARRRLRITIFITGYGGGGDTAAVQVNADTAAANYKYRCTSSADGVTWAAGATGTSTDRVKIAPADSTLSRNVEILVNNDATTTDKSFGFPLSLTGTGSAASNSNFDFCSGGWISPAATQITQLVVMTTTNNMGARSSVVVEGSNF